MTLIYVAIAFSAGFVLATVIDIARGKDDKTNNSN